MTTTVRRVELGVLIALLLLAAFVVWRAALMPAGTVSLPGPGMMPAALGVLLGVSALAMLRSYLRSDSRGGEPVVIGNRQIGMAVLCLMGAGLVLEQAGFILTATAFLFVMLWMLSPLGWWRSLVAAVVASVLTKYLFDDLLNVPLPPLPWRF